MPKNLLYSPFSELKSKSKPANGDKSMPFIRTTRRATLHASVATLAKAMQILGIQ